MRNRPIYKTVRDHYVGAKLASNSVAALTKTGIGNACSLDTKQKTELAKFLPGIKTVLARELATKELDARLDVIKVKLSTEDIALLLTQVARGAVSWLERD